MRTGLAIGAAAFVLLMPLVVFADTPPSAWDVARDPGVKDRWEVHRDVVRDISIAHERNIGDLASGEFALARARLEEADAEHSPDVRLRFDLGEVYEELKEHDRAIAVLRPALDQAADHPAASRAWVELAYAYAHLDRTKEERDAYEKYLQRETDDRARLTALLNLAEADMRLGLLDQAVVGYEDTLSLALSLAGRQGQTDEILATWGLAVALDRNGDARGAAAKARQATTIDVNPNTGARYWLITDTTNVFYVPAYDRYWYLALGKTEDAKQTADAHRAARAWAVVVDLWSKYVADSVAYKGRPDPYLPIARVRLERARGDLARAEKRAKTAPSGARPGLDDRETIIR